jgi:thiol-disulfide isomerase/thioredoxin
MLSWAEDEVATFRQKLHHLCMRSFLTLRTLSSSLATLALLTAVAHCDIISDVRSALDQNKFSAAESELNSFRAQHGVTPEYIDAYSWMGRAALAAKQYDQASVYAKQTKSLALDELKKRPVDAEPHLPLALGAAYEVESQALAATGKRTQAVALLQAAVATYRTTSLNARLQKNLNLLSLEGKAAPVLRPGETFFGSKPPVIASLKGSPVLLFFWAHWCGDCKAEAPIITRLRSEFASKGLTVVGPTRLYGYTAQSENAAPKDELAYIDAVRKRFYGGLLDMPVPVSKYNFDTYGASTTPTLVLLDRTGRVAMYHPGALPYDQLRAEIEKVAR